MWCGVGTAAGANGAALERVGCDRVTESHSLFADVPINETALDRWLAEFPNRDAVAAEYARLLRSKTPSWPTWAALNLAIVDRWSLSGLTYIKTRAWNSIHA
jgi:hypothetical protein